MKSIAVQIEDDQYQELEALADLEKRSVDDLIHQAVISLVGSDSSQGPSLSSIAAHDSGPILETWSRHEILDEMLEH